MTAVLFSGVVVAQEKPTPKAVQEQSGVYTYCTTQSFYAGDEWIGHVQVGDLNNTSGKSVYTDFFIAREPVEFLPGSAVPVTLSVNYDWETFDEYCKIWVDFNQDGDFNDVGELAFDEVIFSPENGTPTAHIGGMMEIPADAVSGVTRMRVVIRREDSVTPCGSIPFGEVEDYAVVIQAVSRHEPFNISDPETGLRLYPNPANHSVWIQLTGKADKEVRIRLLNGLGATVLEKSMYASTGEAFSIDLSGVDTGSYWLSVDDGKVTLQTVKLMVFR
ncbi:MAG: GEVED domain-containing protein [Saprospiraceae bacterium]|nr:GEVED domain-containing protein [Saprospiraceae bacterium]